jgi:tetratricopeptide (TPR) repeat protein
LLEGVEECIVHGRYKEAGDLLQKFNDDIPDDMKTPEMLIRGHIFAARILTKVAKHLEAVQHCLEALKISEKIENVGAQAKTMRWLGHIHWRNGDYNMAQEYIEEGLCRAQKVEDDHTEGILYIELGNIRGNLGYLDEGVDNYRKAIKILEPTDDNTQLARAYNNLGDVFIQKAEWEKGAELFAKCKKIAGNNINMRGWGGFNRAECLVELGRYEEAIE